MECGSKNKRLVRTKYTLCKKKVESALEERNVLDAVAEAQRLTSIFKELEVVHNTYYSQLIESEAEDGVIDEELEIGDSYESSYYKIIQRVKDLQLPSKVSSCSSERLDTVKKGSMCASKYGEEQPHRLFRLPRLELPKFDGELKQWIGFWSQFKKIHEDESIDAEDKFQYLLQTMEKGSSARELVESFPPTALNYPKAIEQLKNRFAREDLLIEHYVRELLQLVISQTAGTKHSTRELYDKMMTQILALESMGITHERYAAFLYPLVESALPEETLRVWNRARVSLDNNGEKGTVLSKLLAFIRSEVESEERIQLSRSSFSTKSASTPTASFLTEAAKKGPQKVTDVKNTKENTCIWCSKPHPSSECNNAQKLSLDQRKELLREKRGCFKCLNTGHNAKFCKKFVKCIVCGRAHYPILCPNINASSSVDSASINKGDDAAAVMKLVAKSETVLLPTVKVNVVHEGRVVTVRALLDSGAQRSFVKANVIKELRIEEHDVEKLRHNLFGGVVSQMETHRAFVLHCQSLDGSFGFQLDALESKLICNDLPMVKTGELLNILRSKGINLTDCVNNESEISMLIGSNVLGTLYTGRTERVSDNLVAVETKLGWTIQGPTVGMYPCAVNFNSTEKIFDISDLWSLEAIGIRDEASVKTTDKRDQEVEDYFRSTIRINNEGRYEVRLPWKETGDVLSSNFEAARKRLTSTTTKLIKLKLLSDYNKVFEEWQESDIIEEVVENDKESGHYLPHHAVVRESSLTTRIRPVFDASATTKEGVCLNSCLEKGSNLITLIPRLLINFRKGAIGITSDIKKAFLQISLYPDDRNYLKFLWWKDIDKIR